MFIYKSYVTYLYVLFVSHRAFWKPLNFTKFTIVNLYTFVYLFDFIKQGLLIIIVDYIRMVWFPLN